MSVGPQSAPISVITPAYRAESFIGTAMRSVLAQSAPVAEVVIASDDGADYLPILAAQGIVDARIRCVPSGGLGSGAARARNAALRAAMGRIIVSLDADDFLLADALAVLAPLALQHGAAYSDHRVIEFESGAPLANYNRAQPAGSLRLAQVLTSNLHTYSCIAFDRQRLPDVGWHEALTHWEDLLFFASCADGLGTLYHTPAELFVYSRRRGSICNQPEAAASFERWARWILREIGGALRFQNPTTEQVLRAYFSGQVALQVRYRELIAQGDARVYQDFLRDNLPQVSAEPF